MAQFGKHLFGTSLFGKSNSFVGTYDTRIVDAGEPFDGTVRVTLDHALPSKHYSHTDDLFVYKGDRTTQEGYTTLAPGSTAYLYVSGKNIRIEHVEGQASVVVKEEETKEERTYTTNDSGVLSLENYPSNRLNNYTITITAESNFELKGITVQTTEIQGWVRATSEELGRSDYVLQGDWPLGFKTPAMDEHDKYWLYNSEVDFQLEDGKLAGETESFEGVRLVQLKLILLTTDSDTAPVVDGIHFYSGDMSKYRNNGKWQVSLDMDNIASEKGVQFERVKRIEWIEKEEEQSEFDLHSSSRNGNTPSILNIMNDSFWSDLTAKYILDHDGVNYGTPYGRISLNQRNNGYSESASLGGVLMGPINPLEVGFTNTNVSDWHSFVGQLFYPRNSNQSNLRIEFYEQEKDLKNGIPPVFILTNPEEQREHLLNISSDYDNLYVRIVLDRNTSYQSAVLDVFNLYMDMHYESARTSNNYKDILSPLDGYESNNTIGKGRKLVRRLPLNSFDWPSRNQLLQENQENIEQTEKELRINYTPKYLNQVYMDINQSDSESMTFTSNYPSEFQVHSQVYAKEPVASTREVPRDELYWHYSYDGGSVNFPITTYRDLTTQFTPSVLSGKTYRYMLENGWSDETFTTPYSMSLKEIADITISDLEELREKNPNVPLYDGKVLSGYEVQLPNNTLNPLINLAFEKTGSIISEFSLLNGTENDRIEAWINESDSFKYLDWTSEEVLFDGVINYNDEQLPYVRVQNSAYNVQQTGNHTVSLERETAREIATRYNVNIEDLLLANNKQEVFKRNDVVVIPGGYSLPDVAPGLIFEGDHPYVIEVIPGSVRRTKGEVRLDNDVLVPGSEDEPAIQYTLTESDTETIFLRRGEVKNGRDHLPVSNVIEVHEIINYETGVRYVPATNSMGDYELKEGHIDWAPTHSDSKEPSAGELYQVTLTRGVVDSLRIVYTSNYVERMSQDRMEAIPVLSENYQIDLRNDHKITLPAFEEMQKEYPHLKNMRYVAENSDLWVNSMIDDNQVTLTLNGEGPNVNWYPTINTGFYYLNDEEYYLYSRPVETVFDDKDIPVIKGVEYTDKGLRAPQN